MYTVYLKVQVECDGEDVECQLLRLSTDVDRVFAGGSPVVLQPGGISNTHLSCLSLCLSPVNPIYYRIRLQDAFAASKMVDV